MITLLQDKQTNTESSILGHFDSGLQDSLSKPFPTEKENTNTF